MREFNGGLRLGCKKERQKHPTTWTWDQKPKGFPKENLKLPEHLAERLKVLYSKCERPEEKTILLYLTTITDITEKWEVET